VLKVEPSFEEKKRTPMTEVLAGKRPDAPPKADAASDTKAGGDEDLDNFFSSL